MKTYPKKEIKTRYLDISCFIYLYPEIQIFMIHIICELIKKITKCAQLYANEYVSIASLW